MLATTAPAIKIPPPWVNLLNPIQYTVLMLEPLHRSHERLFPSPLAATSTICDVDEINAATQLCRHCLLQAKQALNVAEESG
jgi:hypothetical protein